MKRIILMGAAFLCATVSMAQYDEGDAKTPMKPFEQVEYQGGDARKFLEWKNSPVAQCQ